MGSALTGWMMEGRPDRAPVRVIDACTGEEHDMRFVAGVFVVVADAVTVLSPEFGWAITFER